jgi:hypothetical protein
MLAAYRKERCATLAGLTFVELTRGSEPEQYHDALLATVRKLTACTITFYDCRWTIPEARCLVRRQVLLLCDEIPLPSAQAVQQRHPLRLERGADTRQLDDGSTPQRPHHPPWYATTLIGQQ